MLQASSLSALPGIRHAFFTRKGGVSQGIYESLNGGIGSNDSASHVAENRARMAKALGVAADRLLTLYQIHSPTVVIAEKPWAAEARPRADAIVTAVRGLAIGVSTADCGPVLLCDSEAGVIGAAHAGWRGALAGVLGAAVEAMEKLGGEKRRMVAALGPMIRQRHYEVGPELVAQFVDADANNAKFFLPAERATHAMFDLAGYVRMRLQQAGIDRVEDLQACTYADADLFYSFRRATHRGETDYGRHVSGIALEERD